MVTLLIALIVITIGIEVLKTSRRIDMLKAQLLLKETNARRSTEDVHQGPRP